MACISGIVPQNPGQLAGKHIESTDYILHQWRTQVIPTYRVYGLYSPVNKYYFNPVWNPDLCFPHM